MVGFWALLALVLVSVLDFLELYYLYKITDFTFIPLRVSEESEHSDLIFLGAIDESIGF